MDVRNKERLVVKGYSYEKDITFNEASTHILDTIRMFLAFSGHSKFKILYRDGYKVPF